jgi:hypothetical protein
MKLPFEKFLDEKRASIKSTPGFLGTLATAIQLAYLDTAAKYYREYLQRKAGEKDVPSKKQS